MKDIDKKIGWTPMSFNFDQLEDDDDDDEDDLGGDDEFVEDHDDDDRLEIKIPKILSTPIGLFRVDDSLNPFRHSDFWMASCNFDITQAVVESLKVTPGIERFKVISRYSFLIGVGKMFTFRDVRTHLNQVLCNKKEEEHEITNDEIKGKLLTHYEDLKKHKYWAIIVLPNGCVDKAVADDLSEDFLNTLSIFKESRDNCDSSLWCSHVELIEDGQSV